MRILITDKHFEGDIDVEREAVEAADGTAEFDVFDDGPEVTDEAWARAEAVVTSRCTPLVTEKMGQLGNCRIIVRNGVGYDGLDLEGFGGRGIPVCNVPDYGTTEVADHAIAMMLALRRGIVSYDDHLRRDPVGFWHYRHQRCVDRIRGATFGVVGLGRIGTAVARRARAFDQAVIFYDPYLADGADLATGFARAKSLAELFQRADAISVHTPLTEETEGFIDAAALQHAKPGAILINTSRGPVVDVDAVYQALREDKLAGAALDVLPIEPPEAHPLIQAYTAREEWLDGRLILSPHAAFFSLPGQADLRRKGIETILAYFAEEGLRNCVNSQHLRLNV